VTPQTRKSATEELLKKEGIPLLASLPCVESEAETKLRSKEDVAIRTACLFCVVGSAFDPADSVYKDYLRQHGLWDYLTPDELSFLSSAAPDRQSTINFTWRSEALFVLMWSVRLFDVLPLPRQQTATGEIVSRFPGVDQSPWPFIRSLSLRSKCELLDASDLIYRLHWTCRQSQLDKVPPPTALIPGVIQEWHHAINWITGYEDQEWDEVATDT
jgi:hypothetical protein